MTKLQNYSEKKPSGGGLLPNRVIKKLSDDEALALAKSRGGTVADGGRDPVHQALERQWFRNIAYFLGLQGMTGGELEGLLFDPSMLQSSGYTANHIFRIVMGQVSRLSAARPQDDVIPNSPDIEDQLGSQVAKRLMSHFKEELHFRELKRENGFLICTTGNGFISTDWNPRAGQKTNVYRNPFNQELMAPAQLDQQSVQLLDAIGAVEEMAEGDLEVECIAPFQVYVPPGYRKLHEMPWVMIDRDRSLDWLWDNYPKVAPHVGVDELDPSLEAHYYRQLAGLVGRQGFSMPGRTDEASELARVRELWIPPSGRCPRGMKIVICGDYVLENGPHPFKEAGIDIRFPLIHFKYCPMPGRFWGISLVEQLIGAQRDYNRTRDQTIAMRDILGTPQWLTPKGSQLTSKRNDYGDIWEYSGSGAKPELQQAPAPSAMHIESKESALYDMQTISAQSEASQAQVPTGVRSGVAIQALQEKDLSVMGVVVEDQEDGWQRIGENLLKLAHKFIAVPRAISIYGESRQADVSMFKGTDLRGNTKYRITPGSMMPKSKAASMQVIMDLIQTGALNPAMDPKDRRLVHKTMELGDSDKYFQEEDADRRRANIENQMFLKPVVDPATQQPQPYPDVDDDDDHQVHIEEHTLFKKTDAYEKLPMLRKMALEAHNAKHKEALAQLVQTQAMLGQVFEGGGGGGSKPKETGKPSAPKKSGEGGGSPPPG